jgi:hypothetical protein
VPVTPAFIIAAMSQQPGPQPPFPPQGPPGQYGQGQYAPPLYPAGPYPAAPYPPYAGGQAPQPLNYQTPMSPYGAAVVCPSCRDPRSKKVGWTLWGGVIGPRMLSHVKCLNCGTAYNGKTGKSNTPGIMIYIGVSLAIVLLLVVLKFVATG